MDRESKRRKPKSTDSPNGKGRVDLSAEQIYRLDILTAHLSLERRAKGLNPLSRSDVVAQLINPHLRNIVVQVRGELPREGETAA